MSEPIERPEARSTPDNEGFQLVPSRRIESGHVTNDGVAHYYEPAGNPDADSVLFTEGWGTERWMWRWQRQELAERLPDAEYTRIEGGSHFGFIERSERVNRTLVEFLDEHPIE